MSDQDDRINRLRVEAHRIWDTTETSVRKNPATRRGRFSWWLKCELRDFAVMASGFLAFPMVDDRLPFGFRMFCGALGVSLYLWARNRPAPKVDSKEILEWGRKFESMSHRKDDDL